MAACDEDAGAGRHRLGTDAANCDKDATDSLLGAKTAESRSGTPRILFLEQKLPKAGAGRHGLGVGS